MNDYYENLKITKTWKSPFASRHADTLSEVTVIMKHKNFVTLFVGKLPTNCLSVFDHFVGLSLKGLNEDQDYLHSLALL